MPGERLSRGRPSGYVSFPIHFDLFPAAFFVHFSIPIPLRFTYAAPTLHKIRQLSGSVLLVFALMYYIPPVRFDISLPTSDVPVSPFTMFLHSKTLFLFVLYAYIPLPVHIAYNAKSELARASIPPLHFPFVRSAFSILPISSISIFRAILINPTINSRISPPNLARRRPSRRYIHSVTGAPLAF